MVEILVLSGVVPHDLQLELLKKPVTISAREIAQVARWTEPVILALSHNGIVFDAGKSTSSKIDNKKFM